MSKGRALAILTMDTEYEIKQQIKELESREECRLWASVERNEENRTWVFEALREKARALEGPPV